MHARADCMLQRREDSLILNQSAIDRGLFRSTTMKTTRDEARSSNHEEFGTKASDRILGRHQGGYDKVDASGIAAPGTRVKEGEVVVLKTAPAPKAGGTSRARKRRDLSSVIKKGDDGVVDAVMTTLDEGNNTLVKLRTRSIEFQRVGPP